MTCLPSTMAAASINVVVAVKVDVRVNILAVVVIDEFPSLSAFLTT